MPSMKHAVIFPLVLFFIGASADVALSLTDDRAKQLERERQKFAREDDPVSRAKIGIKISDLLLDDVAQAVKAGNFEEMEQQLIVYTDTISAAHETLAESGRNAAKKSGGFKELEIALRKHARKFEDFARVLNIQRRLPLEKAKDFANTVREKLLKALFP
jgi:hypothetical protein